MNTKDNSIKLDKSEAEELLFIKSISTADTIYVNIFGRIEPYYKDSDRQWFVINYKSKEISFNSFDGRNGSGFSIPFSKYKIEFSIDKNDLN